MEELSRRNARLWSEQMQMCTPVDNSWWGQGPQRRVKCVSDPPCSQFWGHSLLGTWHTQCLMEEVWGETSAQPQAVHRRMCSGWIIQEPQPWKTAVQMRCSDADCLAGGSVCSLLSLIMPRFSQMWHGPISPKLFEIAQFLFVFFFFFFFFFLVTYFKKCAGSSFYLELQF